MSKVAIFPGSFDPFTQGHQQIVNQGLRLFDTIIVAIGRNTQKHGLLDYESRKRLIEDIYLGEPRVSVEIYDSLTIEYAREKGATAMIRGIRSAIDFEYERSLASINARLDNDITTVMLLPTSDVADISSSVIRELHAFGHNTDEYMPKGFKLDNYTNKR